jgi:hypothetical protein
MPATLPAPAVAMRSFALSAPPTRSPRPFLNVVLGPLVVLVAATLLAALAYTRFLDAARHLWTSGIHDRNAHYWLGLSFGLDFRNGDLLHFFHDLHAARVWGPLHPLLVGVVLAIGGPDYRLAVLPSLAAWVGTALFAFLAARRAVPRGGNLAGLAAALFVLASPAHQAFATDIMLESLGACLSLAALYACLVAVQERSAWGGRLLGLTLTLLFFHKYNYWLLVVLPLAAAALAAEPRRSLEALQTLITRTSWRAWLIVQLRHPLTYLLVPLGVFLAIVFWHGGGTLQIGGQRISLNTPHNVVHVAFLLLVLRLLPWWWRTGRPWIRQLDAPARQLVSWHLAPVLLWFLWPQRLGYFLWYLTRDHGQEQTAPALSGGMAYYWHSLGTDYHLGEASLLIAVALAGIALLSWRRLRPGGVAVLWFVLVATALTFHHPTHRSRFLHSWVAAGWVVAGIGLAQVVYGRLTARRPGIRPWLAVAVVATLAFFNLPGMFERGNAPEGGPKPDRPSVLEVTDAYVPLLDQAPRPAIFANLPVKFLTGWTLLERRQRHIDIETELKGFGTSPAADRRCFESWLRTTPCDAIVLIDLPPGSAFYEQVDFPDYRRIQDWLAADGSFTPSARPDLARFGCTVTIWRRVPSYAWLPREDVRHGDAKARQVRLPG